MIVYTTGESGLHQGDHSTKVNEWPDLGSIFKTDIKGFADFP